jgi:ribonuclease HI
MTDTAAEWTAWVDATALPNPGRIGIGLVLVSPAGVRQDHARLADVRGCNNEAEVRAVAVALELASAAGARRLTIFSDSRFAVDCLNGLDRTAIRHLDALLSATKARLPDFDMVRIAWLPGRRNVDADRLARSALGLPPRTPPSPPAKRRRRRTADTPRQNEEKHER